MRRASLLKLMAATLAVTVSAPALAADSINVRLKWFHQAQFAGFYVAAEKGFYKEHGLDVTLQPGGPDFPAIQMIAGGNEHFGVTGADQVLVARSRDVPVVALAVLYRKSPFVLFSLKQSGITAPDMFTGKKVGVKLGGNEELIYRTIMKKTGVGGVTEVPVKFDMTPLLTRQVDVWPGYVINEVISARAKGFDVNVIWPSNYGVNLYGDTIFTTEKMLKEKPDVVQRFVAATLKGWNYAVANPEKAAKLVLKYAQKSTFEHELAMMRESVALLQPDRAPIGSMEPAAWTSLNALLTEGGFIKKPIAVERAYTTQFLPK